MSKWLLLKDVLILNETLVVLNYSILYFNEKNNNKKVLTESVFLYCPLNEEICLPQQQKDSSTLKEQ